MTDRGVSEVVSFILVFSLIALTVGVVYVGGVGSLETARDAERVKNAVKAFDVLDDNVDDIVRENAPSRATELKLAEADLRFGNTTTLNVTAEGPTDTYRMNDTTLAPIVYEAADTELVYEAGAVIRSDRGGSVLLSEPPMLFGVGRTAIPYVQTRSAGLAGTGGSGTVLIRTDAVDNGPEGYARESKIVVDANTYTVTLNLTTDRSELWASHLEEEITAAGVQTGSDPCTVDGRLVSCEFETDGLYVSVTRIDVTYN